MKFIKKHLKEMWQDESGLGTLEMVMLAVLLVGLVMFLKPKVEGILDKSVEDLGSKVNSFTAQ